MAMHKSGDFKCSETEGYGYHLLVKILPKQPTLIIYNIHSGFKDWVPKWARKLRTDFRRYPHIWGSIESMIFRRINAISGFCYPDFIGSWNISLCNFQAFKNEAYVIQALVWVLEIVCSYLVTHFNGTAIFAFIFLFRILNVSHGHQLFFSFSGMIDFLLRGRCFRCCWYPA